MPCPRACAACWPPHRTWPPSVARWIEQAGDKPVEAVAASADSSAGPARTGAGAGGGKKTSQSDEPDPLSLDAAMGRLAAWGATSGKLSTRNSPKKNATKGAKKQASASASAGDATSAGRGRGCAARHGRQPCESRGSRRFRRDRCGCHIYRCPRHRYRSCPTRRALTDGPVLDALAHAVRVLRGVDLSEADLAHARAHLPDHLRMTFVVTDASGKELGAGKDLAYLQRSLAHDANKAVRTAVRAALEEASEKQAHRNKRGRGGKYSATTGANGTTSGVPSPTDSSTGSPGGENPSTTPNSATATGNGPRDAAQASSPGPHLPRGRHHADADAAALDHPDLGHDDAAGVPRAGPPGQRLGSGGGCARHGQRRRGRP